MISGLFPSRRVLCALAAMVLTAPLAACTSSDMKSADPSSPAKTTTRPAISLVQTVATRTPHGPDDPAVARVGDVTVVAYYDTVRAVTTSGAQRWTFTLPAGVYRFGLGVVVDGATTVITWRTEGGDTSVRAVDTATGRLRWTYRTSMFIDTAAGTVFATACNKGDTRCTLRALDPATGAVRWTRTLGGRPYVRLQDDVADHGLLAPTIGTKAILEVYTGGTFSDTSHLERLDVATGRTRPLPGTQSSYARVGDVVAFVPNDGKASNGCTGRVTAVDLQTGRQIWARAYPLATTPASDEPACDDLRPTALGNGVLAVHPTDRRPVLLDIRTGRVVATTGSATGRAVDRSGDLAIVLREVAEKFASNPDLSAQAVRADGTRAWSMTFPESDEEHAAVISGLLVVGARYFNEPASVVRVAAGAVVARVQGRLAAHGENWFATWDRKVLRIYDVRV